MGGFLPYILLVMLPGIALSLWASWRVKSSYSKWDKVDLGISMKALDFARYLLNQQGLNEVGVEPTPGHLTDHYDPRTRTLRVSQAVSGSHQMGSYDPRCGGRSASTMRRTGVCLIAAAAVIAHEVGHAAQHKQGDKAMALRQLIVPVASLGSTLAPWLIIIGLFMNLFNLALIGLVFFAAAVAFTFVTLPVEFGASNRALAYLGPIGLNGERADGARSVLKAAGWTYVAAALTALLSFLYYLSLLLGTRR